MMKTDLFPGESVIHLNHALEARCPVAEIIGIRSEQMQAHIPPLFPIEPPFEAWPAREARLARDHKLRVMQFQRRCIDI